MEVRASGEFTFKEGIVLCHEKAKSLQAHTSWLIKDWIQLVTESTIMVCDSKLYSLTS